MDEFEKEKYYERKDLDAYGLMCLACECDHFSDVLTIAKDSLSHRWVSMAIALINGYHTSGY